MKRWSGSTFVSRPVDNFNRSAGSPRSRAPCWCPCGWGIFSRVESRRAVLFQPGYLGIHGSRLSERKHTGGVWFRSGADVQR